jgi:starvation-inducible DNA-binding protein
MVPSLALELQNISALHIKYHVRQSLLRLEQLQKSKQKERLSEEGTIRQRFDEIEANPISLPEEYCKQAVEQLNTDLASHFTMFFQFKKQHWIVEGPDWKHLHEALDKYAKTIAEAADKLAERINLLGGLPVSNPSRFTELAYVMFEGEDKIDLRAMLENDLHAEQIAIQNLRERIQLAQDNNDYGTDENLKDILEDHEEVAHELDHYLRDTSLEETLRR